MGVDPQTTKRLENGTGSFATPMTAIAALDFHLVGLGPGVLLPEQLRLSRQRRLLSLEQMAARAGMSRATVAKLEQGKGTVVSLMRLLAALAPKAPAPRTLALLGQGG